MRDDILISIISALISLFVTLSTLFIKRRIDKKKNQQVLKINMLILIKDIRGLLSFLEKIIEERAILNEYILQDINYNQILLDYNNIYNKEKDKDKLIRNLLDFYNIRESIDTFFIKNIQIPGHWEREIYEQKEFNVNKLNYIKFVENIYIELEDIFINNNLEAQLNKRGQSFYFNSIEKINKTRKENHLNKKQKLENDIDKIINKYNIDLFGEPSNKIEVWLLKELDSLKQYHNNIQNYIAKYNNTGYSSDEEVCADIISMQKQIYDIKEELE